MGSGYKNFTAGSVLTASDVNNYLMEQTVMVFSTTTARDAAITAPEDGMICYVTGDDAIYIYETIGATSAWRRFAASIPHTSTSGLLTPATTRTNSGTTYANFPGTDLLKIDNFVKHRSDTQLLVTINGSIFASSSTSLMFGVLVNSIDYDIGMITVTATSSQTPYSVTNMVNVPTAGTYTIQARWKPTSGTWTVNEFTRHVLTVTEVRP